MGPLRGERRRHSSPPANAKTLASALAVTKHDPPPPGAAFILGRRALVDLTTVAIAGATWLVFQRGKKVPEPLVIVTAGRAGLVLHRP